jgi:G3E family GTPase
MNSFIEPTIPVTVITGFLGSGKTTLLAALLAHPDLKDTAVIANELGEIGLDHELIEIVEGEVVLLAEGCLCCALDGDLTATLQRLMARRRTGGLPAFRRVVVETTGLADPAPILQTIMSDSVLLEGYRLEGVIATVDAVNGGSQLKSHPESMKQAAIADRIVLTKTDLVDAAAAAALTGVLAALNPTARILPAVTGRIAPDTLLDCGAFDPATKTMDVQKWLGTDEAPHPHHPPAHPPSAPHHRHDTAIHAESVVLDAPVDYLPLARWIEALIAERGEDVLRVKGILDVRGEARPVVIHGVQHVFHPPSRLRAWPEGVRRSRLVFIARGFPDGFFSASLLALQHH